MQRSKARIQAASAEPEDSKCNHVPNARFIVLDPNGEYARAFEDLDVRLFRVESKGEGKPLKVPAWLWNGEEWAAFTEAASGAQRPVLFKALRRLRGTTSTPDSFEARVAAMIQPYRNILRIAHSTREYLRFPGTKNVTTALESIHRELSQLSGQDSAQAHQHLGVLQAAMTSQHVKLRSMKALMVSTIMRSTLT